MSTRDDYNRKRPLWFKSEAPETFKISRKLCMGEMKDICEQEANKLHVSSLDDAARNRTEWLNETPAPCTMKRRTCTIGMRKLDDSRRDVPRGRETSVIITAGYICVILYSLSAMSHIAQE